MLLLSESLGQTVEKPQELFENICCREVLRKIRLSRGALPKGKSDYPQGPPVGKLPDHP